MRNLSDNGPVLPLPVPPAGENAAASIADQLIPIAAELVATVRDYGPDTVGDVLDQVPDLPEHVVGRAGGKYGALAVVLAAMVDPDKTLTELLGWTIAGPVQSRGEATAQRWAAGRRRCPDCGREMRSDHLKRHRRTHHDADASQAA